jgi:restriction system protein
MAIPSYQTLMLPLLKLANSKTDLSRTETIEALAPEFGLSDQDRKELLPSGLEPRFDNRVGWATTYLKKAGLLEGAGRARSRITKRGVELLKEGPPQITAKFLERYPEYLAFKGITHPPEGGDEGSGEAKSTQTPEEALETSYQTLRLQLAQEILQAVSKCPPKFFETLVVDLLLAMGYGGTRKDAGQAVGQSGDDGVDGIINEDKLGLDIVYIQAKRWTGNVGRPHVQTFVGSLEGQKARKGVFITTSKFSSEAREYVKRTEKRIVLIDGEQLAQLMIEHGVGVTDVASYVVKKIDSDYFNES